MTALHFDAPGWLWLLPLAALPWLLRRRESLANTWLASLPRDGPSDAIGLLLHAAAVMALAALVIALAGPYRPEYTVERVGRGAEIVLVLDRSRSMDQGFAGTRGAGNGIRGTGPEALDYYARLRASQNRESKGQVARQLLADFAARRPEDRFGMVLFSTLPLRVLEFTQKPEPIQAAIAAGNVGRGLSETNIGLALESALGFFDERAYTGSRIVMLVSDGGDRLDAAIRERIAQLVRKHRVAVYWIYLRSAMSTGLVAPPGAEAAAENAEVAPEYFLHRFFESLGTPYRAYEADNPEAMQKAIEDVNRLENLPIVYEDVVPRRSLAPWALAAALAAVLLLLAADLAEIRRWT
ncbi:vWA domain-containing protein [Aquincola sp. MAHUQ-54]|uniref:VWA domain-containing protein n=1 Tax=Aquincola agrisoli TaxID=3119538 RepID=A0AAW9QD71_9BURK